MVKMFGNKKGSDYSQVNLDDFSDDSSNGGDDFVRSSIRNQQVRLICNDNWKYIKNSIVHCPSIGAHEKTR